MTRNELKLEIWNRLNVCPLTEEQVAILKKELSEDELGAFVDLFCDYLPGMSFISDERHKEDLQKLFEDLTSIKEMTGKYLENHRFSLMQQMRNCSRIDILDDCIKNLFEQQKEIETLFGQDVSAYVLIGFVLDYLRILRAKADVPSTEGLNVAEALMLKALEKEEDGWILHVIASFFCFFIDDIADINAAACFFESKKMFIEQYARELMHESEIEY